MESPWEEEEIMKIRSGDSASFSFFFSFCLLLSLLLLESFRFLLLSMKNCLYVDCFCVFISSEYIIPSVKIYLKKFFSEKKTIYVKHSRVVFSSVSTALRSPSCPLLITPSEWSTVKQQHFSLGWLGKN